MPHPLIVVGLGESLFDVFPDRAILGGAPLNVAYHAHQLCSSSGGRGVVASRIGDDELGQQIIGELQVRKLSYEFVQRDSVHPTGRVDIALRNGEPTYKFLADVAWDHLEWTSQWEQLAKSCDAVVFGTLAQRCPVSRKTIQQFVGTARQAIRLFDVNLRVNFFDVDSLRQGAEIATAIKLNEDEMPVVLQMLGFDEGFEDDRSTESAADTTHRTGASRLLNAFGSLGLKTVVVTRGARGTALITADDFVCAPVAQFPRHPQADNVGAGDACSAGLLWGWLNNWSHQETVTLANRLGAFVASQPGATPPIPVDFLKS